MIGSKCARVLRRRAASHSQLRRGAGELYPSFSSASATPGSAPSRKRSVADLSDDEVRGKKVLVRVDFNVPLNADGSVSDDTRVRSAVPTIAMLLEKGARVVLASHLGRPKGEPRDGMSLNPGVLDCLATNLASAGAAAPVSWATGDLGDNLEELKRYIADDFHDGVCLLENVRFYPGEEKNDPEFSQRLYDATQPAVYVNDAFGTVSWELSPTLFVSFPLSLLPPTPPPHFCAHPYPSRTRLPVSADRLTALTQAPRALLRFRGRVPAWLDCSWRRSSTTSAAQCSTAPSGR